MSYIDNNLMSGESVIYRTKLHWVVFMWPVIWLVIAIVMFGNSNDAAPSGALALLVSIVTGIVSLINYKTSEFGLTNKRTLVKVGFIRRNSVEVLLTKVEGIQVKQGILGRILGFGSIIISGTGGAKDPFHKISSPLEFRKKVQEQISSVQDSK